MAPVSQSRARGVPPSVNWHSGGVQCSWSSCCSIVAVSHITSYFSIYCFPLHHHCQPNNRPEKRKVPSFVSHKARVKRSSNDFFLCLPIWAKPALVYLQEKPAMVTLSNPKGYISLLFKRLHNLTPLRAVETKKSSLQYLKLNDFGGR